MLRAPRHFNKGNRMSTDLMSLLASIMAPPAAAAEPPQANPDDEERRTLVRALQQSRGAAAQKRELYDQGQIPLDTYLFNMGNDSGEVKMRGGRSSLDQPYQRPQGPGHPVIDLPPDPMPLPTRPNMYPSGGTVPEPSPTQRGMQTGRGTSDQLKALYQSGQISLDTYLANMGAQALDGDVRMRGGGSSLDQPYQRRR